MVLLRSFFHGSWVWKGAPPGNETPRFVVRDEFSDPILRVLTGNQDISSTHVASATEA